MGRLLSALSRKRREPSLLFQFGRGERALSSSDLEEGRGLSPLPIWKRREGSLLFLFGRGERDLLFSNLEEEITQSWDNTEGNIHYKWDLF